jgi:hypothetical protein
MKEYDVYFSIYGKKLKTTVLARNEGEAMEYVRSKLLFHKITLKQDDHLEQLKNILGL